MVDATAFYIDHRYVPLSNRENTADIGPQRLGALFCSPNSLADVGMCADVFGDFGIIFVLSVFDIVPPPRFPRNFRIAGNTANSISQKPTFHY